MSKSTTFRSVSYGPCSRTGVTCVASDSVWFSVLPVTLQCDIFFAIRTMFWPQLKQQQIGDFVNQVAQYFPFPYIFGSQWTRDRSPSVIFVFFLCSVRMNNPVHNSK